MTRPHVNWFAVIIELANSGVTMDSQAAHCEVVEGTIRYWKQGGQPKHSEGELLLGLYVEKFPERTIPLCKRLACQSR